MVATYRFLSVFVYVCIAGLCALVCLHLGAGPFSYATIVLAVCAYVAGRQDAAPKWWED